MKKQKKNPLEKIKQNQKEWTKDIEPNNCLPAPNTPGLNDKNNRMKKLYP